MDAHFKLRDRLVPLLHRFIFKVAKEHSKVNDFGSYADEEKNSHLAHSLTLKTINEFSF